ncbi:hypothetical protein [Xenorhabdus sp. SGI240]|uniref:hypothetical protein n=1 Tax=Xenorhabdus sp. SGI240 TaxID=3158262 RepID=UPI0032B75B53
MSSDCLDYLIKLPDITKKHNNGNIENVKYIFTSHSNLIPLSNHKVKIKQLSYYETSIVIRKKFDESRISNTDISKIHDLSEGVVMKLLQIMTYLESASAQEVISQIDIFDDAYFIENIPESIIDNINILKTDKNKANTFTLIKILSVLKNGESITNIKKTKHGRELTIVNTKEIIDLGLGIAIHIDRNTTIIKITPIITDYILSIMSIDEINSISEDYLLVSIVESKDGFKLNSVNRKIIDSEFNTEGDNGCVILINSINKCLLNLKSELLSLEDKEKNETKLNKLKYLSNVYVYALKNSSRFKETINSSLSIINSLDEFIGSDKYKYFHYLAYSHRMIGEYDLAMENLEKAKNTLINKDKKTQRMLISEELLLLEKKDIKKSINLAEKTINEERNDTVCHLTAQVIITTNNKEITKKDKIEKLMSIEKKSRILGFNTLSNNILFRLNKYQDNSNKLKNINKILSTDASQYNVIRARLDKYQILIENNMLNEIDERTITELKNIYDYLFTQRLDALFNKCHDILWKIAEEIKNIEIIYYIYSKGILIWWLNSDKKTEKKYLEKLTKLDEK